MLSVIKDQLSPAIAHADEVEGRQSLRIIDERTGKEYRVPVRHNTIPAKSLSSIKTPGGPPLRSFDPGLVNTSIASSSICYIDGEKGVLRYRGYPIEQLAEFCSYEEICFLLFFGETPSSHNLFLFKNIINKLKTMPEPIKALISSFNRSSPPLTIFICCLAALRCCCPPEVSGVSTALLLQQKQLRNRHLIGALAAGFTIAANIIRYCEGLGFVDPPEEANLVEGFLQMVDGRAPNPTLVRALEVLFILHAEHEMNCSTAALRLVASSHADPYTCLAAAAAALFGPRHGSANEAAVRMLRRIGTPGNVPGFIEKVKRREEKLIGFGHRVYKNYDPRAFIIKQIAKIIFKEMGRSELTLVANELEKHALKDFYFTSRRLYPNIDFYSGVVYTQLGFREGFFPLLFAAGRLAGWVSHLNEYYNLSNYKTEEDKLIRPQQIYKGQGERNFKPKSNNGGQAVPSADVQIKLTNAERRQKTLTPKL